MVIDLHMSYRKDLDKLNTVINSHDNEINKMVEELSKFQIQKNDLIIKIIEDENILKNSKWDLEAAARGMPKLIYSGKADDPLMEDIHNMLGHDNFCWLDIDSAQGIQLQIEGTDVQLSFDHSKTILPFVKKHGLKISGTNVTDKLLALKREVNAIEQLVHQFALKD